MKNPTNAAIIMFVVIFISALLGGGRSLASESRKVEKVFTNGAENDGLGIASDLGLRIDASYNLVTVALKYLPDDTQTVRNVLAARDQLIKAKGYSNKFEANQQLTEATTDLNELLISLDLNSSDISYRKGIMSELTSSNSRMSHDPYNTKAEAFNSILDSFPANIISRLTRTKHLPLFR